MNDKNSAQINLRAVLLYTRLAVDDFKIRIEVSTTMKRLMVLMLGLTFCVSTTLLAASKPATESTASTKQKQIIGFLEVPKRHWAYEAFMRLSDAGLSEFDLQHRTKDSALLTRYEFALVMGRFFVAESIGPSFSHQEFHQEIVEVAKKRKVKSKPQTTFGACGLTQPEYQEAVEIMTALRSEFQRELEILGFEQQDFISSCPVEIMPKQSNPKHPNPNRQN